MTELVLASKRPVGSGPKGYETLKVTAVKHWSDRLFSFETERPASLRFRSGEFVMMGLEVDGRPLVRAYSIASPNWSETLEFYSIKVPDGPLTSRLQRINPGDFVLVRPKPVGTLVTDALIPGSRLFLLSTGTGIAPFASLIRDPDVYERFNEIILVQSARLRAELEYGETLVASTRSHEVLGELVGDRLKFLSLTTRENSPRMGRINTWVEDGRLAEFAGGGLDPHRDRVMICGSMDMLQTLQACCEERGFAEGSNAAPGQYVIEKAFVD